MLSNLDALLSAVVPACTGSEIENRDKTDTASCCNTDRKINCPGCPGCPGGFDSARDAKILILALNAAGPAGLDWREGTPPDWSDDRLLDAGEALYSDGRMVNVLGRRYLAAQAPRLPDQWSDSAPPQTTPQNAPSAPTSGLADDPPAAPAKEPDTPLPAGEPADPQAARIAELMATGWAPWNAKARAESEALPGWQRPPLAGVPSEFPNREVFAPRFFSRYLIIKGITFYSI